MWHKVILADNLQKQRYEHKYLIREDVALALRDFIAERQCALILELLAEKQLIPAKKSLYALRHLQVLSQPLQELNAFSDYLLSQEAVNE